MKTLKVLKTSVEGQSILTEDTNDNIPYVSVQLPTNLAHLFSAAPELLECVKMLQYLQYHEVLKNDEGFLNKEMIDLVINKAEGKP